MALKRIKFLLTFCFVSVVLSLMVFYSSSRFSASNSSTLVSYASTALHDRINQGLGYLPSPNTLKTFVPERFKWSNWRTSDAVRLEESLINYHPSNSSSPNHHNNSLIPDRDKDELIPKDPHYNSNGLYYLSSESSLLDRHPILDLISYSEKKWEEKVSKSSKNLQQCVEEYRRRYNRSPPFGFEKWWEFAEKNGVILKDEYDRIIQDLKPFRAIEPSDLRHRSWVMANERPETFTLTIDNSHDNSLQVKISGGESHLARAKDLAKLIQSFSSFLPMDDPDPRKMFNLTFTRHDQPAVQMTWARKQKMIEMADVGEYFSPSDYIRPPNPKLTNWANACPPNSPLYRNESNLPPESPVPNGQKSFIYDHQRAMQVCDHPESMALHGFTSAPGTDNVELVPLFTFAKASTQSDILVTPLEQYSDTYIGNDPDWGAKKISKLLWRGSTTGAEFKTGVDWKSSQRARLHIMSHQTNGTTQVLKEFQNNNDKNGYTKIVDRDVNQLNLNLFDTSFSGGPVQCDPVTCDYMSQNIKFAGTMGLDESYQYKYLIDVDGNGWSGRFHRLISTKSLVFKSSIFPEWYTDRVQPWVHYVPVKVDYSDLYDLMVFFKGDIDGTGGRDDLAEKIATAGKRWAAEHWRRVDMAAYMFRLILEWRRVMLRGTGAQLDYIY